MQLQHLRSLTIVQHHSCFPLVLLQKPTDKVLAYSSVPSSSSCEAAHVNPLAHVAPTLTSLKLHRVHLNGFPGGWQCLGALTGLQQLDLQQAPHIPPVYYSYSMGQHILTTRHRDFAGPGELGGVLLQLECLTQLRLAWQMDITVRAAFGLMTQLRELKLQRRPPGEAASADAVTSAISLPPNLTRLEIDLWQALDRNHAPDLAALTALQHLQLVNIKTLDPGLLSSLQQLTHLHVAMRRKQLRKAGMTALLDVLPCLQKLQHLDLLQDHGYDEEDDDDDDDDQEEDGDDEGHGSALAMPLQQCTALLSSSRLTSLQLQGVQLPAACGVRMFGTRLLPQLTAVKINFLQPYHNRSSVVAAPALANADLASLVDCCPCLAELDLAGAVMAGADVSVLKHLASLTALVVGGACTDDRCAEGLAQLAGLKRLSFTGLPASSGGWDDNDSDVDDGAGTPQLTLHGLQQLMHLTQLTCLTVGVGCCWLEKTYGHRELQEFRAPAPSSSAWDDPKLQVMLQRNRRWLALLLQQRDHELAALKASAASMRHELAAAHERIAALQQQQQQQEAQS
uniref:Uncharacterized protein n=1 Tax=Tetradesmus obliquus TaxID=3088 RepID=A0A383VEX2_TETOB|eukprot:jgi/Sobl393_1/18227/SZX63493.1